MTATLTDLPLFANAMRYPNAPSPGKTDTSRAAAPSVSKGRHLQTLVMRALRKGPSTADEVAERLGLSILAIRPRLTELGKMGAIQDTGERRKNISNKPATVWRIASPAECPVAV